MEYKFLLPQLTRARASVHTEASVAGTLIASHQILAEGIFATRTAGTFVDVWKIEKQRKK